MFTSLTTMVTSITKAIMGFDWQMMVQLVGTDRYMSCSSYRDIFSSSEREDEQLQFTLNLSPAGMKLALGTDIPKSPINNWKPGVYHFQSTCTSNRPLESPYFTIARTTLKLMTYWKPPNQSQSNSVGNLVQFQVELLNPKIKNAQRPLVYPLVSPKSLANIQKVMLKSLYLQINLLVLMRSSWLRKVLSIGGQRAFTCIIMSFRIFYVPAWLFSILLKIDSSASVSLGSEYSMQKAWVRLKGGTTSGCHQRYPATRLKLLVKQEGSRCALALICPYLEESLQSMEKLNQVATQTSPIVTFIRQVLMQFST